MIALLVIFAAVAIVYAGSKSVRTKAPPALLRRSLRLYLILVFFLCLLFAVPLLPRLAALIAASETNHPRILLVWIAMGLVVPGIVIFGFLGLKLLRREIWDFRHRHETPEDKK